MIWQIYLILPILLISVLFIIGLIAFIQKKQDGTPRMKQIADQIHKGAMAFLKREYTILSVFMVIIFLLLYITMNIQIAISYIPISRFFAEYKISL